MNDIENGSKRRGEENRTRVQAVPELVVLTGGLHDAASLEMKVTQNGPVLRRRNRERSRS